MPRTLVGEGGGVHGGVHLKGVASYLGETGRSPNYLLKEVGRILAKYDLGCVVEARGVFDSSGGQLALRCVLHDLKAAQMEKLEETLCGKVIHGAFYSQCQEDEWDTDACKSWLVDGRLRSETEGLLVAAQDGVIPTQAYRQRVRNESISPLCRICSKSPETIGHLLSVCDPRKWKNYKERHDRVLFRLVRAVSKQFELALPEGHQ